MEGLIGIAVLVIAWNWSKSGFPGLRKNADGRSARRIPVAHRMDSEQQKAALEAYKHAVSEKMDVLRTAIQMGWGDDELKRLDARLEELIGEAELKRLIDGEIPQVPQGGPSLDPQDELSRLRKPQVAG